MKETIDRLQKSETAPQKGGLFRRSAPAPKKDAQAAVESCILCERLEHTMERYVYTLLYMYEHEKAFREAFAASKGLCLPHYFQVMQDAPRHLSGKTLEEFSQTAMRVERENLARVEKDLEWFTLKFDYLNKDKPWGNSQDAVERAINKPVSYTHLDVYKRQCALFRRGLLGFGFVRRFIRSFGRLVRGFVRRFPGRERCV